MYNLEGNLKSPIRFILFIFIIIAFVIGFFAIASGLELFAGEWVFD